MPLIVRPSPNQSLSANALECGSFPRGQPARMGRRVVLRFSLPRASNDYSARCMNVCATRRAALAALGATLATPASVLADALAPPIGSHIPHAGRFSLYAVLRAANQAGDRDRRLPPHDRASVPGRSRTVSLRGGYGREPVSDVSGVGGAAWTFPRVRQQLLHSIAGAQVDRHRGGGSSCGSATWRRPERSCRCCPAPLWAALGCWAWTS